MSDWEIASDITAADEWESVSSINPNKTQEDKQNWFWSGVNKINEVGDKYLAPIGGGALQGLTDVGTSVLNIPHALGLPDAEQKIEGPQLKQYLPERGGLQDVLFAGGEIASTLPFGGSMFKAAGKALPAAKGIKGVGLEALKGGAVGAAISDEAPGGRLAGAGLGGLGGAISSLTPKSIINKLSTEKSQKIAEFNKGYNELFGTAKNAGVESVKTPKLNLSSISDYATKKESKSLNKFLKNPTIENAHWAQSDLGKLARDLGDKKIKSGLTSTEKKSLEAIKDARKRIKGSVYTELRKNAPELIDDYASLTSRYAKEMVPFNRLQPLSSVEAGKIKPSTALNKISKNEEFMLSKGGEFPEIGITMGAKKYAPYVAGAGLASVGLPAWLKRG